MKINNNVDLKKIKLIISDFDGVLTDNRVLVDENGKEAVFVNRSDGLAVGMLRKLGIEFMILSTEKNPVVTARARKLKVECVQGCDNKQTAIKDIIASKNLSKDEVMYIGNDINDYEAMKVAGIKVTPNDAYPEVKNIADIVTEARGGMGVIREIAGEMSGGE